MKHARTKLKKFSHSSAPATVALVREVRAEMKADLKRIDSKLDQVHRKIEERFQESLSVAHRTLALMEEQRSENRIVLDAFQLVMERMDRLEGHTV